ncbi:efflux RND transporter periplasmic adaptor subunit [bacterium]|nr:efflux RND transporter periplasmic adaptor subunit [bacterium]
MIRPAIAILLAFSFTFVNPCSQEGKIQKPKSSDKIYEVTVVYPKFISVPKKYFVQGTFDVSETSFVTANTTGDVEQVYVTEGDHVEKDDPIVVLSNVHILEQIDLKRAKIKEYQARLSDAEANISGLDGEDRPVSIEETQFLDEEPIDEPVVKNFGDANDALPQPQTLKTLIEVLDKHIEVLTKEADILDRRLLELNQSSPVDGVVTKIFTSDRNKVKEQDKLVAISQINPLSITFKVPQETANYIDKHSTVTVTPKDAPDIKSIGTVYYIGPNIEAKSGKVDIRAHVANENGLLKGGQEADVFVSTRKMGRVVVLPKSVVHYDEDKQPNVFIAFRNQAKLVEVSLGEEMDSNNIQIHGDLRVDDPIIVECPNELKHNSFVKMIEQKPGLDKIEKIVKESVAEETGETNTETTR